jgi:hypothetical protein
MTHQDGNQTLLRKPCGSAGDIRFRMASDSDSAVHDFCRHYIEFPANCCAFRAM